MGGTYVPDLSHHNGRHPQKPDGYGTVEYHANASRGASTMAEHLAGKAREYASQGDVLMADAAERAAHRQRGASNWHASQAQLSTKHATHPSQWEHGQPGPLGR